MAPQKRYSSVAAKPISSWKICLILSFSLFLFKAYQDASFLMITPDAASSDSVPRRVRNWDPYGSFVPEGPAVALPSIQIAHEEDSKIERGIYGGKGDKPHLGGFTAFDKDGVSVSLWKHMVNHLGIKSVLDLGCGRGTSTSWFVIHGLQYVVCAEGSHDAVTQSLLPKIKHISNGTQFEIVEHDFSRGPWWPSRTVVSLIYSRAFLFYANMFGDIIPSYFFLRQDAVWCVEVSNNSRPSISRNTPSPWPPPLLRWTNYFSFLIS
jgi:hypothetical protein